MKIKLFPAPDFSPESFMGIAIGNADGTLCGVYALVSSHSAGNTAKIESLIKRFAKTRDDIDYTKYDDNRCGVYRKAVVKGASTRRTTARQMAADLSTFLLGELPRGGVDKQETREIVDGSTRDVTILTFGQTGRKRRRERVVD